MDDQIARRARRTRENGHRIVDRTYDPKPGTDRLLDALRFLYEGSLRRYCDWTPVGGDYGSESCCRPATVSIDDDWYCAEHRQLVECAPAIPGVLGLTDD